MNSAHVEVVGNIKNVVLIDIKLSGARIQNLIVNLIKL